MKYYADDMCPKCGSALKEEWYSEPITAIEWTMDGFLECEKCDFYYKIV